MHTIKQAYDDGLIFSGAIGYGEFEEALILEVFGPQRCMFGSDWPVCLLAGTYDDVVEALQENLNGLTFPELEDIFRGNASRFYRI